MQTGHKNLDNWLWLTSMSFLTQLMFCSRIWLKETTDIFFLFLFWQMKEQVKLLNKNGAHFAVGTPNRISSLMQADALKEEETYYVILDWNWRDVKLRRMVDMPEVRNDLFELLKKYIIPAACSNERLRIGLF